MRVIGIAAIAGLLLASAAFAETNVGVTAAVNQAATGTASGTVRTISLGDNVVHNERVQTGTEGLVQILLADGTTFMVGPNSDLVIDSFVYDPAAGTAQMTASFTKGVLRFIGGQASKADGGVTLSTPVGTMGIRGAMVDVVLDPPAGTPPHVDMLFGNEVTLEQGRQLLGRLYAAGYSLVLGRDGGHEVRKTPPEWSAQIQQLLAGKPGTNGGAPVAPTDDEVGQSELADNNWPSDIPGFTQRELDLLLRAAAEYDELRDFIISNPPPPTLIQPTRGLIGGVVNVLGGQSIFPLYNDFDFDTVEPSYLNLGYGDAGTPTSIEAWLLMPSEACAEGSGCVVYQGGASEGQITANIAGVGEVTIPTTSYLYDHNAVQDPALAGRLAAELNCSDCDALVRWGFWGFEGDSITINGETTTADGLIAGDGLWVTGDLTTAAQLANLASQSESGSVSASYTGDAVANVKNGTTSYVATGDLYMDWNFAKRQGTVTISDFDNAANYDDGLAHLGSGATLTGSIDSIGEQNDFSGLLFDGVGTLASDGALGFAQGAFVNDGNDIAAGVLGNFGFTLGDDYIANGVFFGTRGTPR